MDCGRAATVHIGGTFNEIAASDRPSAMVITRSAFCVARATIAVRSLAGSQRQPYGMGVLPRAKRFNTRHAAKAGSSDSALCPRVPRLRCSQACVLSCGAGSNRQKTSFGGDINGGAANLMPFPFSPTSCALRDLFARHLHLFLFDSAGRRSTWNVRFQCRQPCARHYATVKFLTKCDRPWSRCMVKITGACVPILRMKSLIFGTIDRPPIQPVLRPRQNHSVHPKR